MENINISKTIDTLSTRRKDWEQNAFKKSNDMLYQLLDDCLKLYILVKDDKKLIKALNADLKARGVEAILASDTESIISYVSEQAIPGVHLLVMSNGSFDNIHTRLLAAMKARPQSGPES